MRANLMPIWLLLRHCCSAPQVQEPDRVEPCNQTVELGASAAQAQGNALVNVQTGPSSSFTATAQVAPPPDVIAATNATAHGALGGRRRVSADSLATLLEDGDDGASRVETPSPVIGALRLVDEVDGGPSGQQSQPPSAGPRRDSLWSTDESPRTSCPTYAMGTGSSSGTGIVGNGRGHSHAAGMRPGAPAPLHPPVRAVASPMRHDFMTLMRQASTRDSSCGAESLAAAASLPPASASVGGGLALPPAAWASLPATAVGYSSQRHSGYGLTPHTTAAGHCAEATGYSAGSNTSRARATRNSVDWGVLHHLHQQQLQLQQQMCLIQLQRQQHPADPRQPRSRMLGPPRASQALEISQQDVEEQEKRQEKQDASDRLPRRASALEMCSSSPRGAHVLAGFGAGGNSNGITHHHPVGPGGGIPRPPRNSVGAADAAGVAFARYQPAFGRCSSSPDFRKEGLLLAARACIGGGGGGGEVTPDTSQHAAAASCSASTFLASEPTSAELRFQQQQRPPLASPPSVGTLPYHYLHGGGARPGDGRIPVAPAQAVHAHSPLRPRDLPPPSSGAVASAASTAFAASSAASACVSPANLGQPQPQLDSSSAAAAVAAGSDGGDGGGCSYQRARLLQQLREQHDLQLQRQQQQYLSRLLPRSLHGVAAESDGGSGSGSTPTATAAARKVSCSSQPTMGEAAALMPWVQEGGTTASLTALPCAATCAPGGFDSAAPGAARNTPRPSLAVAGLGPHSRSGCDGGGGGGGDGGGVSHCLSPVRAGGDVGSGFQHGVQEFSVGPAISSSTLAGRDDCGTSEAAARAGGNELSLVVQNLLDRNVLPDFDMAPSPTAAGAAAGAVAVGLRAVSAAAPLLPVAAGTTASGTAGRYGLSVRPNPWEMLLSGASGSVAPKLGRLGQYDLPSGELASGGAGAVPCAMGAMAAAPTSREATEAAHALLLPLRTVGPTPTNLDSFVGSTFPSRPETRLCPTRQSHHHHDATGGNYLVSPACGSRDPAAAGPVASAVASSAAASTAYTGGGDASAPGGAVSHCSSFNRSLTLDTAISASAGLAAFAGAPASASACGTSAGSTFPSTAFASTADASSSRQSTFTNSSCAFAGSSLEAGPMQGAPALPPIPLHTATGGGFGGGGDHRGSSMYVASEPYPGASSPAAAKHDGPATAAAGAARIPVLPPPTMPIAAAVAANAASAAAYQEANRVALRSAAPLSDDDASLGRMPAAVHVAGSTPKMEMVERDGSSIDIRAAPMAPPPLLAFGSPATFGGGGGGGGGIGSSGFRSAVTPTLRLNSAASPFHTDGAPFAAPLPPLLPLPGLPASPRAPPLPPYSPTGTATASPASGPAARPYHSCDSSAVDLTAFQHPQHPPPHLHFYAAAVLDGSTSATAPPSPSPSILSMLHSPLPPHSPLHSPLPLPSGVSPSSGGGGGGGGLRLEDGLVSDPLLLVDGLGPLAYITSGAFAAVYRGSWEGVPVAIKFLASTSLDLNAPAVKEAMLGPGLEHPNIIRTYTTRVARIDARAISQLRAVAAAMAAAAAMRRHSGTGGGGAAGIMGSGSSRRRSLCAASVAAAAAAAAARRRLMTAGPVAGVVAGDVAGSSAPGSVPASPVPTRPASGSYTASTPLLSPAMGGGNGLSASASDAAAGTAAALVEAMVWPLSVRPHATDSAPCQFEEAAKDSASPLAAAAAVATSPAALSAAHITFMRRSVSANARADSDRAAAAATAAASLSSECGGVASGSGGSEPVAATLPLPPPSSSMFRHPYPNTRAAHQRPPQPHQSLPHHKVLRAASTCSSSTSPGPSVGRGGGGGGGGRSAAERTLDVLHALGVVGPAGQPTAALHYVTAVVMEYADMGNLDTFSRAFRNVPCDPSACVGLLRQVADGMRYLHSHGLVHGDLKPANLLLVRDPLSGQPVVRVADFGLSGVSGHNGANGGADAFGTIAYSAPERLSEEGMAEHPADVYSFGICLQQLVTGDRPFADLTYAQTVFGVLCRGMRPPWTAGRCDVLRPLYERCCDADPGQRPTFGQVIEWLDSLRV